MNANATFSIGLHSRRWVWSAAIAWLLSYFAARYALEAFAPPPHWDIAVANIPTIAFFWFVWVVQRALKASDELQRRIHLESLAMAFPTVMLVLMTLGLLDAQPLGPPLGIPLRELWVMLPPLYGICYLVVMQRYR